MLRSLPAVVAVLASLAVPVLAGGTSSSNGVVVTGAGSVSVTVANGRGNGLDLPPGDVAFPIGSDGLKRAQDVAAAFWGAAPCGGNVAYAWTKLDPETNATASWRNPTDAWNNAGENFDCRIDMNPDADYDFPKLCTVVAHEVGHLLGQQHAAQPGQLMSAIYTDPIQQCIDADPSPVADDEPDEADSVTGEVAPAPRAKSTPKQMLQRILARRAAARRAAVSAARRCGVKRYRAHGKRTLKCRPSARSRARAAKHAAR